VTRQKLTLKGSKAPLANDVTLKDAGAEDGAELSVKDLGPQIGWKTVFLIEYVR
jgi:very-long-chain enoyl-CoA reductase